MLTLSDTHRELILRARAQQGDSASWHPLLTEVPSMCVFATLGYEAYLRLDGRVVVAPDVEMEPGAEPQLHFADIDEAAGVMNMAALSRYPELRTLIPLRPADASPCATCDGRGSFIVAGQESHPIFCSACHSLGWHSRATS